MRDKRKNGRKKQQNPAQQNASEAPRRKRLHPVSKSKYKLDRYYFSEDLEEEAELPDFRSRNIMDLT